MKKNKNKSLANQLSAIAKQLCKLANKLNANRINCERLVQLAEKNPPNESNKKLALMAKLGIKRPKGMPLNQILLSKIGGRPYLRCRAYKGIGAVEGYVTISEYRAMTKAKKQFFKAYLPLLKTFNRKRIILRKGGKNG